MSISTALCESSVGMVGALVAACTMVDAPIIKVVGVTHKITIVLIHLYKRKIPFVCNSLCNKVGQFVYCDYNKFIVLLRGRVRQWPIPDRW